MAPKKQLKIKNKKLQKKKLRGNAHRAVSTK